MKEGQHLPKCMGWKWGALGNVLRNTMGTWKTYWKHHEKSLGTLWKHSVNIMGTHWDLTKNTLGTRGKWKICTSLWLPTNPKNTLEPCWTFSFSSSIQLKGGQHLPKDMRFK
jgi:hypothetical protein